MIGCGYSGSEIQRCSALKLFPPFLYGGKHCYLESPIGQKPETDPHHKIGSRSIGAVGKHCLTPSRSLSFSRLALVWPADPFLNKCLWEE